MGWTDHKDTGILISILIILVFLFRNIDLGDLGSSKTTILLGTVAFTIPIILAFSRRFNLSTRFGNGEVRKAIVISLTIIYIILLSTYFFNVSLPIGEKLNSSLGVLGGMGLNNSLKETNGMSVGGNGNTTINVIPSEALRDITTNFFWIYAVIIIFYFGSRAWESVAETNMVKDLKDIDPQELLQRRYILGSISPENFRDINDDISDGRVILLDATPRNDKKDTYDLIIRNMGPSEKTVIRCSLNGEPLVGIEKVKLASRSYRSIEAKIDDEIKTKIDKEIKKSAKNEYRFEITLDNGDTSGITRKVP